MSENNEHSSTNLTGFFFILELINWLKSKSYKVFFEYILNFVLTKKVPQFLLFQLFIYKLLC